MKNVKRKSIIAILLAAVICLMGACGEKFDAGAYVKACLDAQFKGEYDEYIKMTDSTKADAEKLYKDGLDELMSGYESLALSDELNQKFRDAYAGMLKAAKYSIKETKEKGDDIVVVVAVKPMKCFETYEEDLTKIQEDFIADWQTKALNGEQVPDEAALMEQIAQKIYEDLVHRTQNTEYDAEKTVDVRVTLDSKKVHTVNEDDLAKVAEAAFSLD